MTNDNYGADDLREDVSVGRRFFVETFLTEDTEVVETDVPTGTVPDVIDVPDESWAFIGREVYTGDEWYFLVDPTRGGTNDGVALCFWFDHADELAGHHEVYPRAFNFVDEGPYSPSEMGDGELAREYVSLSRHLDDQPDPHASERFRDVMEEICYRFSDRILNE